jgi:hypothetical protein
MLKLTVDFNAVANGLVRGLQEDALGDGEPVEGALIVLDDGEGNEALGTVREVRDGLVFAAIDWDTFGSAGLIKPMSAEHLQLPGQPKTTTFAISGSVWRDLVVERPSERIEGAAERVFAVV